MRYQGVAYVTGAAGGIGRAIALRFSKEGGTVAVVDIDEGGGEQTCTLIEEAGGKAMFLRTDITIPDSVRESVRQAHSAFGRIDALVNNAGTNYRGFIEETSEEDWDRMMNVNARGSFLASREIVPIMKRQRSGSIVNISSIAGLVGLKERVAYTASKGAILAMTRALAIDLALEGIRVNCICPGSTATAQAIRVVRNDADRVELAQRQALGRLGEPDEIASAVVYLCLPEASFITGAVIPVDGGMTAR